MMVLDELHCLPMATALSIRLPDSHVGSVVWDWWSRVCLYGFSLCRCLGLFGLRFLAVVSLLWLWACFVC